MPRDVRDPHQKALALNLEERNYGTIAEIGKLEQVRKLRAGFFGWAVRQAP